MHENSFGSHMSPFLPNLCFPVKEMFTKRLTPSELDKPVLVLKSMWDCNIMNIWFINWLARCFLAVLIIKDYYREVNFLTTTDSLNVYCLKGVLFCGAEERWPVILLWYLFVFFSVWNLQWIDCGCDLCLSVVLLHANTYPPMSKTIHSSHWIFSWLFFICLSSLQGSISS